MRHALTAEQQRSEIYSRVAELKNEVERLEEEVDQLNQESIEIVKRDEEERTKAKAEHEIYKKDAALRLMKVKEDLDTVLTDPNMIVE